MTQSSTFAQELSKPAPGTPSIKFDQTTFDFGKTSQVQQVTGTFTFENVGTGLLRMEKPQPSCGCTIAGVKPEVLQPGQKGELTFTLHLPKTKADLHKQITVVCNDPQHPRTVLNIKAEYVPLYDVTPAYANLNIHKGSSTNFTVRVTRTDGKPFHVTDIKLAQTNATNWIHAKAEADPKSPEAVLITTTLTPETSPRYFSEILNVFVDGEKEAAFPITLYGRILGDVTWMPEMIYWPISNPKTSVTNRVVLIRSSLAQPFAISNLTSTLPELRLESVPQPGGTSYQIQAHLTSFPAHTTNGFIQFQTSIPSQSRVDVPVTIALIPAPLAPNAVRPNVPRTSFLSAPPKAPVSAPVAVPSQIDPAQALPAARTPAAK